MMRIKDTLRPVLVLCLCALLTLGCLAANSPDATVTINGTTLSADHPYYKNDGSYGTADSWTAKFDATNSILTLRNLDITTSRRNGIEATGDLTLVLEGTNSIGITCGNDTRNPYSGIQADSLTVCGSGSLTVPTVRNDSSRQAYFVTTNWIPVALPRDIT